MEILHICSYYLGSKLYKNLFNNLNKSIRNYIFVPINNNEKINISDDLEENNKIYIEKCFNSTDRLFFFKKNKKILEALMKTEILKKNISLLHAHTLFTNGYVAYKIKKKYNIPYIVAIRNTDINVFFKYFFFLRKYGIKILKNANKIIFLSPSYEEYCLSKYIPKDKYEEFKKKSIVIPNGIDKYWIENLVDYKKRNSELRLIYVGSINENKNVKTSILACRRLIEKGYQVKFTIIGDLEINLKEIKEPFIEYIPFCSKERIKEYLSESDIFIMPSKYETFGLVYAEALSQGLPIIYTRGQGFDKQIPEGKVGYSVKYNDIDEIIEKIIKIYNNYDKYSAKTKEYVNKFNWKYIAEKYEKIYNEVVNREAN
ncbi:MAG: glycosyltransferase family 4 protein [Fusobacterium sp.]|uniref:glycosyltransferase family 4 protein n=1 Tax=Fusobacterium sp. TaxID=68766 RepID=UPI0026DD549A|nr:glycosyltransferase family 4 protein [Fusobacterium sp.]MDO4690245.1 glycosyltransferase family 4 protein [Fusobacterium sp.]